MIWEFKHTFVPFQSPRTLHFLMDISPHNFFVCLSSLPTLEFSFRNWNNLLHFQNSKFWLLSPYFAPLFLDISQDQVGTSTRTSSRDWWSKLLSCSTVLSSVSSAFHIFFHCDLVSICTSNSTFGPPNLFLCALNLAQYYQFWIIWKDHFMYVANCTSFIHPTMIFSCGIAWNCRFLFNMIVSLNSCSIWPVITHPLCVQIVIPTGALHYILFNFILYFIKTRDSYSNFLF